LRYLEGKLMLVITIPDTYPTARDYIISVILKEFLGLNYLIKRTGKADVSISDKDNKRRLLIPDVLFATPVDKWLTKESLPKQPLEKLDTHSFGIKDAIGLLSIPVIYGPGMLSINKDIHLASDNCLRIPIDIFGSAFFMLTRYEEIVNQDRDEHDRFPATASIAYKAGFLNRPIIDEYVEILWAVLKLLWPGLERKKREFAMCVSHDADFPSRYGFLSIPQTIRAMGGDILMRGDIALAVRGPWIRLNSSRQIHMDDPYNTFDYIMDVSEHHGLVSAFYFICGESNKNNNEQYKIEHPAIRHLLRRIHQRGHEIGLHPSYGTYKNPRAIITEADHLRRICAEEGIKQTTWGGRMHFLQWEMPTTLYGWAQAGMAYDNTMCYADHTGFRCGTCHEYPAFDPVNHEVIKLNIRPLVAMDQTIMNKKYMGMGLTPDAYDEFIKLKRTCQTVHGAFTLLWHNSQLTTKQERELYEAVIRG